LGASKKHNMTSRWAVKNMIEQFLMLKYMLLYVIVI
jgi:hypothetical protein